jgi:hypothetical protein
LIALHPLIPVQFSSVHRLPHLELFGNCEWVLCSRWVIGFPSDNFFCMYTVKNKTCKSCDCKQKKKHQNPIFNRFANQPTDLFMSQQIWLKSNKYVETIWVFLLKSKQKMGFSKLYFWVFEKSTDLLKS